MANLIKLRRSAVQGAVPTTAQLELGELAINTYDGKLFIKKNNGTDSVIQVGSGNVSVTETAPTSPQEGDLWFNSADGSLSVYYVDINSGQWVVATGSAGSAGPTVYPSSGIAVSTGTAWDTSKTSPTGDIVGTTDTQTLSNKTITGTRETVFTITDGASVDINPANGGIQIWTLGGNRTPTASNFLAGQSVTLLVDDGSAFSITWTSIGVTWLDVTTAPTLQTTGYTIIELFRVGSVTYGMARR